MKSAGKTSPKGPSRKAVEVSYWYGRVLLETGWTVKELNECPIPTFWLLVHILQERDEEQAKALG